MVGKTHPEGRPTEHASVDEVVRRLASRIAREASIPGDLSIFARAQDYTPRHLRRVFRRQTGTTMQAMAREAALARASRLLLETDHPVREVAAVCGYADPAHFGRIFRRRFGTTPGRHREGAAGIAPRGPHPIVREDFSPVRRKEWTVDAGTWEWGRGVVGGTAEGRAALRHRTLLGEAFLVEFDFQAKTIPGAEDPQVGFCLVPESGWVLLRVVFPAGTGFCRVGGPVELSAFARSTVSPSSWHHAHAIVTRMSFDLSLDGAPLLRHRFLFPPAGLAGARFVLEGHGAHTSFRRLRIYPLPSPGTNLREESGDERYAVGDWEAAAASYEKATFDSGTAQRIALKIAECRRRLGNRDAERRWLRRCLSRGPDRPWTTTARLRLAAMEGNDSLLREAARLLGSPQDRSAALVSLWEEAAHAMSAERFETALGFASCLATYESYHPRPDGVVRTRVEALERLSRFADAAAAAQSGVEHVAGRGARFELLRAQAHALGMAGRTDEALRSLRKAEGESAGRRAAWSALFTRGLVLRAAGRFEEARRCFERAAAHTSWYEGRDHALFHAAMLDAVAGTWPRAKRLVSQMRWLTSEHAFAAPACLSLMRGEHDKAFEQLERAVRSFDTTAFWPGARLAAAVLGETCGDMDRARRLFHEVVQTAPPESPAREVARFHLDRIDRVRLDCALGGLAASGGVFLRPLFTYLEGLSLEVKERPSEAAAYYARAVREDPTRYWPSVLAERRLRSLG